MSLREDVTDAGAGQLPLAHRRGAGQDVALALMPCPPRRCSRRRPARKSTRCTPRRAAGGSSLGRRRPRDVRGAQGARRRVPAGADRAAVRHRRRLPRPVRQQHADGAAALADDLVVRAVPPPEVVRRQVGTARASGPRRARSTLSWGSMLRTVPLERGDVRLPVVRSGPEWDASRPLEEQSGCTRACVLHERARSGGFIVLGGPLADEQPRRDGGRGRIGGRRPRRARARSVATRRTSTSTRSNRGRSGSTGGERARTRALLDEREQLEHRQVHRDDDHADHQTDAHHHERSTIDVSVWIDASTSSS